MQRAGRNFNNHPVNIHDRKAGKKQANSIWLWDRGRSLRWSATQKIFPAGRNDFRVDMLKALVFIAD